MKEYVARILGIALMAFAVFGHKYFGAYVFVSFLAGLIIFFIDKKTASRDLSMFLKSFKQINKRFVFIAFYDMLCLSVFFVAVPLFSRWFTSNLGAVAGLQDVFSLFFMLLVYFAGVTLILLLAYTIFKGLIWLALLNKKPSAKYFKKFFLLNLCWWIILFIPFIIVLFGMKQEYLIFALIVFAVGYVHMTSVMHFAFTREPRIGSSLKKAFVIGWGNIKDFLVPYSLIIALYFVLLQVFWIVPKEPNTILFASLLFTVFFLAWYRIYLAQILRNIYKYK